MNSRLYELEQEKKVKEQFKAFICWVGALPITALAFWWYNHMLWLPVLPYLVWLGLAIPLQLAKYFTGKWITSVFGLVFLVSLVVQILSWAQLISIPLFK